MRQADRLLGLARRYGDQPVVTACQRALEFDVVNVTKIARMLEQATETTPASQPTAPAVSAGTARFARDPAEFNPQPVQLSLVDPTGKEVDRCAPSWPAPAAAS